MNREELLNKILKLKALSDRGIGGEREAARQKLILLMDRYGFTDNDLGGINYHAWPHQNKIDERLLSQVIYSVMGSGPRYRRGRKREIGLNCTKPEAIEIEAKYEFYKTALKEDLEIFMMAFIMRNHIYPPESKEPPEVTEVTEADIKAYGMSKTMDVKDFHKQICSKKGGEL